MPLKNRLPHDLGESYIITCILLPPCVSSQVGERVNIEGNGTGTLRYVGSVKFAPG